MIGKLFVLNNKINSLCLFFKLSGNSILPHLVFQQILHLNIDVPYQSEESVESGTLSNIFILIVFRCQRLISLNFGQLFYDRKCPICLDSFSSTNCTSSTSAKLKVNVTNFDDCLYILDAHFKQLST